MNTNRSRLLQRVATVAVVVGVMLRLFRGITARSIADELYTSAYSRQDLSWVFGFGSRVDTHGPLHYLARHPFSHGQNLLLLRAPSIVFAVASMVLVWAWMRRRGEFGVAAIVFTAVNPFLLMYGLQARMYSAVILAGTATAMASERWLRDRSTRWAVIIAAVLSITALAETTMLLVAGGAFLLPWLDRTAAAWKFRAASVTPFIVYGVLLGPTLHFRLGTPPPFAPYTNPTSVSIAINGLVTIFYPHVALITVAVVAGGMYLLWHDQPLLGRTAVAVTVVPFLTIAIAGIRIPVLIPRALTFAAWVVPFCMAALVDRARVRVGPAGVGVAIALPTVLMVPSLLQLHNYGDNTEKSMSQTRSVLKPGDAIAVVPRFNRYLLVWEYDSPVEEPRIDGTTYEDTYVVDVDAASPSGRVWIVTDDDRPLAEPHLVPCPDEPPVALTQFTATCFLGPITAAPGNP